MLKPAVALAVLSVATSAFADTVTTEANTLVVVTPNAPVVVQQGAAQAIDHEAIPSAAPGAASTPIVAPVAAPPQNEAWSNISHINGMPVKVGEKQDYLYKPKKFNLSANPFGLFFGYYDVAGAMALGQNLAASVSISHWSLADGHESGTQISATLPLYFRKTFSGPFLEGGIIIRTSDDNNYGASDCIDCMYSTTSSSDSWAGPQMMFGWHWTFDSGLNTSFAFGLAKRMAGDDNETTGNAYFRVGYAF